MSASVDTRPELPALPLAAWQASKDTLHLWAQVLGKVRMTSTAPRNHWWHVPLYVDVRGLTTRRMHAPNGLTFQIDFDFVDHHLLVTTSPGAVESFALVDGLSVAAFDELLHATLRRLEIDVTISERPFGMPMTTPFPADAEHATYDRDAVTRFWRILDWTDSVFEEFAGWYCGKTSPVHLFWHSLDLAVTRFGARRAPARRMPIPSLKRRTRMRSSRSASGPATRTSPNPPITPIRPPTSRPARASALPRASALGSTVRRIARNAPVRSRTRRDRATSTLLAFLESAYEAGADLAGWDRRELASTWCPDPPHLEELLGRAG